MGTSICALHEKRLVDRLRSLKVTGDVIDKRRVAAIGGHSERGIVVVEFRNREIETHLDDSKFEQIEIGDQICFSPPVPRRDPCNCHLFVWLIVGLAVGALAIWAITSHFHGRTASLLSLAAAGWISVIAWARICSHEDSKCNRYLKAEIDFFDAGGGCEQGEQQ